MPRHQKFKYILAIKALMKKATPKNLNNIHPKEFSMKLLFEFEDAIIGVVCGLLVIGLTGRFFSLELSNWVYTIAFIIFAVSIILDVMFEFTDLKVQFGFTIISLIHSVIDFIIALAFISHFSGFNIPFVTSNLVPYLQNDVFLLWIGIFLVVSNAIWLCMYPFFGK